MPPNPAYNWICVLSTATNILSHAAQYRAAQVASHLPGPALRSSLKRKRAEEQGPPPPPDVQPPIQVVHISEQKPQEQPSPVQRQVEESMVVDEGKIRSAPVELPIQKTEMPAFNTTKPSAIDGPREELAQVPPTTIPGPEPEPLQPVKPLDFVPQEPAVAASLPPPTRTLQASKVPSSRIGRLFHYGGLAASLGYGAATELLRRTGGDSKPGESLVLNQANIKRLVSKLSQMRGAALKLGQFLSIQDTHVLPPDVDEIFRRVQDAAHYMPDWQLEQVLKSSLGEDYTSYFASFERIPAASASIGQVHFAVLAAHVSPTGKEEPVAVKVQFPGVKQSVQSDLGYVRALLNMSGILPRGLFLDRSVQVLSEELSDECDYTREASFAKLFRRDDHLGRDNRFKVPWVWEGSTDQVLVMERMKGVSVGQADSLNLTTQDRNEIATRVLELCLRELFELRLMQTDPNWTNFLWNAETRQIELVDFGATREYSKEFMDAWYELLNAAAKEDRDECVKWSLKLGYLTGEEIDVMVDAHVTSMQLLATPFKESTPQPYSFGRNTEWARITQEIRDKIPIMLKHRLTPPPRETYSLNRKLSGAFLLASRLGAVVDTRAIWEKIVGNYPSSA